MQSLELVLEKLNDKVDGLRDLPKFSEGSDISNVPQFEEGRPIKQLGLLALGGALAPMAGSYISKYVPQVGSFAPIAAGFAVRMLLGKKYKIAEDIGDGMIIAGFSKLVSDLLGGKLPFSEAYGFNTQSAQVGQPQPTVFSETRVGGVNFG